MTLRWRYYLAVVPLLLGLGIASAAVLIHLVHTEAAWGMQQRAEGVATSVAEFLPILQAAENDRRRFLLQDTLRRLGVASLTVHRWPLEDLAPQMAHAADGIELPPLPPDELRAALREQGTAWMYESSLGSGESARIFGYALAFDDSDTPYALVSVAELDDSLAQALKALQGKLLWIAGVLFVLACVIAEWLTRSVQRELGTLIAAASELEAGRSAVGWKPGRIQEVNDLGGTLQTMGSLLEDGVQRTRLGFFEAETIPTRRALARQVQRRQLERMRAKSLPADVAWRALGEPPHEHFLDWQVEDSGWTAVIGVLGSTGTSIDPLETGLLTQALAGYALRAAPGDAVDPASDALLEPVSLQRIHMHEGQWTSRSSGAARRPEYARDVQVGERVLYGTLDEEAMQIARMYVAQTADRPLGQVIAELESLLGERYSGFLWAFEGGSPS